MNPDLSKSTELRFVPKTEKWSIYTTYNGEVETWIRKVVTRFARMPDKTIGVAGADMTVSFASPRYRGTASASLVTPDDFDRNGRAVPFVRVQEPDNEYVLVGNPEQLIVVRVLANRIRILPNRFDAVGQPYVSVDWALQVSPPRDILPEEGGV